MKKVILTVLILIVVSAASFFIYVTSGSYDISQLSQHNSFTKWVIKKTTHNSIEKRIKDIVVPANINDQEVLVLGFQHYNEMCSGCHGAPGMKEIEMPVWYPKPPKIYKHKEQEDPKEFFWIIKNGIKMTAMPAYGPTHDDQKIWAITAFVTQKLNTMSAEEYNEWVKKYPDQDEDEKK